MVAFSIGSWQVALALAGLISVLNIREDRLKKTIYINPSIPGSIILVESGHYFCPSYCGIEHVHSAHKGDYQCSHSKCSHMIYDSTGYQIVPISKVKKRKASSKSRGFPIKFPMPNELLLAP